MEERKLRKYFKNEKERKIFAKVFDEITLSTIQTLSNKGLFDVLEFVISTGKEAHVFRARDKEGNFRAVKIFKVETSDFKNMEKYLAGDNRFTKTRRNKRDIVYDWVRKEHNNLERAVSAGVRVPLPLGFKNNVLVMEFIGTDGIPSKPVREVGVVDVDHFYEVVVDFIARVFYKADLIHADLSEYNLLMLEDEPVIIDIGQAVLRDHPSAREFFERDVSNMSKYFQKLGLQKSFDDVYNDIKGKKKTYSKDK